MMGADYNVKAEVGGMLWNRHPCPVDEYTSRYVPHLAARRFAMTPVGHILTVNVGSKERATAYAEW